MNLDITKYVVAAGTGSALFYMCPDSQENLIQGAVTGAGSALISDLTQYLHNMGFFVKSLIAGAGAVFITWGYEQFLQENGTSMDMTQQFLMGVANYMVACTITSVYSRNGLGLGGARSAKAYTSNTGSNTITVS